jgi:hypothetical protein
MWALRSWNRVWKKQGVPYHSYQILREKFDAQIENFNQQQRSIFENAGTVPEGFEADSKIAEIRQMVDSLFEPEATQTTLQDAYDFI